MPPCSAYASGEVLNEVEVQRFHQLYEEIRRRAPRIDMDGERELIVG